MSLNPYTFHGNSTIWYVQGQSFIDENEPCAVVVDFYEILIEAIEEWLT